MNEFEKVEQGIIEWNKERGNTEFSLNLEMMMLLSEAQEYFIADNLIDKFDALLDYIFVGIGSVWKCNTNNIENNAFYSFVLHSESVLWEDFEMQLEKASFPMNHFFNFINDGLEIVLKYNNKKSAIKDKNGKIVKPENWKGPEKELEVLFNEYMNKK